VAEVERSIASRHSPIGQYAHFYVLYRGRPVRCLVRPAHQCAGWGFHLSRLNRRLFIPDAKAGEREQPITPELAELLASEREMRQDRQGWIFPSPHADSAAGHRARMGRPFRDAVKVAGLDPELITPHVMRHTAITKLVQAGVDLPTVQRISGHKTVAMVLRYSHVHGRHIDEAIRALGRTLPKRLGNEMADTITQELHTAPIRAPIKGRRKA
jgi:Phage integrase family